LSDVPKTSVTTVINKHLYAKSAAPLPYTPKPGFSPSKVTTPCLRRLYYEYLKVTPDEPFQSFLLRIFAEGHAIHEMVQGWLEDSGQLIAYRNKDGSDPKNRWTGKRDIEFPAKDKDLEVSGKIDGVGIVDDELWLYEIKSIKAADFKKLTAPIAEHIEQAMMYVYIFEKNLLNGVYSHMHELDSFRKVAGIIFIYVNKDSTFMKEYRVKPNILRFEKTLKKMSIVKRDVANNQLSVASPSEKNCQYCSHKQKCDAYLKFTKSTA